MKTARAISMGLLLLTSAAACEPAAEVAAPAAEKTAAEPALRSTPGEVVYGTDDRKDWYEHPRPGAA